MKTKDIDEIISLCHPISKLMDDFSELDSNSLTQIAENVIKIKPVLEDFSERVSQKDYLKSESTKQDFLDNVDGLVESIDELQELISDEGLNVYDNIMNFDDVRTWIFMVINCRK